MSSRHHQSIVIIDLLFLPTILGVYVSAQFFSVLNFWTSSCHHDVMIHCHRWSLCPETDFWMCVFSVVISNAIMTSSIDRHHSFLCPRFWMSLSVSVLIPGCEWIDTTMPDPMRDDIKVRYTLWTCAILMCFSVLISGHDVFLCPDYHFWTWQSWCHSLSWFLITIIWHVTV